MISDQLTLFWGDLHNHNAVGYAKGSLERSIDLAKEHLDFFAFTGHASWHDIPKMPGDSHFKWFKGFDVHTKHWPKTRKLIKEANDSSFVSLLGYEWHSSEFGDYHLIFPEDQPELYLPDHVEKLLGFAQRKGALAIPHHVAYKQGWRGLNWKYFNSEISPIVEIYSEHGCTETDRTTYPMLRHSIGGISTSNTLLYQLSKGLRFGFVASTDDHYGYPGAYGEGITGVWAKDLTPSSIFESIKKRRTIAATGDRIKIDFTLNGQPMGSEIPYAKEREIEVVVEGPDSVEVVELVQNGRVLERHFPEDKIKYPINAFDRSKCRIQYGWGPWATLKIGQICSWDMTIHIEGGQFLKTNRCFQCGPYKKELRDKLQMLSENTMRLESYTSRDGCFAEDPTKSIILDMEAGPEATLSIDVDKPTKLRINTKLRDLMEDNIVEFTGIMTSESFIIHRLVFPEEFSANIKWVDRQSDEDQSNWYYIRTKQHNGHIAWSSPIWIG